MDEHFDHTDPVAAQDVYGPLAHARERCPVLFSAKHGGFWVLTRYADVIDAANDYAHFTTRHGVTIPPLGLAVSSVPLMTDPPEHTAYRRSLQPFFSPSAIAGHEPAVRKIVVDQIVSFASRGEADLVKELARPVPCTVVAVILGLEPATWPAFNAWVQAMEDASLAGDLQGRDRNSMALKDFLVSEIESRKGRPQNDLLSVIARLEIGGEAVPDVIRYGMAQLLLVAGHDSTVSGIANLLRHLMEHPDLRRRLPHDRELLDQVIDESLRFESPVFGLARTVETDTSIDGVTLSRGDRVLVSFGAANHDPARFPDPDAFCPMRPEVAAHVAFGHGRHRCLGEHLARLELRVTVEELLTRIPDYHLQEGAEILMRTAHVRGPKSLQVSWETSAVA